MIILLTILLHIQWTEKEIFCCFFTALRDKDKEQYNVPQIKKWNTRKVRIFEIIKSGSIPNYEARPCACYLN